MSKNDFPGKVGMRCQWQQQGQTETYQTNFMRTPIVVGRLAGFSISMGNSPKSIMCGFPSGIMPPSVCAATSRLSTVFSLRASFALPVGEVFRRCLTFLLGCPRGFICFVCSASSFKRIPDFAKEVNRNVVSSKGMSHRVVRAVGRRRECVSWLFASFW